MVTAMAKNDLLRRQQEKIQIYMDAVEAVMKQFMVDTLQATLHDDGWGYERIKKLTDAWGAKYSTYYPCLNSKDVEADYLRFCLDRELKHMIRGNQEFYPFEERYPELKQITYGGKK